MKALVAWARDHLITERKELFVQGEGVCVERVECEGHRRGREGERDCRELNRRRKEDDK